MAAHASPSTLFRLSAGGTTPFRNARAVGAYEALVARSIQEEVS